MSVVKPRNRLVFFRVSEEEFRKLNNMCQSGEAARSISELARLAVHRLIVDNQPGEEEVVHKLQNLDKRIDDLHEAVRHLTHILTSGNDIEKRVEVVNGKAEQLEGK